MTWGFQTSSPLRTTFNPVSANIWAGTSVVFKTHISQQPVQPLLSLPQVSPGQQGKSLTTSAVTMSSGSASAAQIEAGSTHTTEVKATSSESSSCSTVAGPPEPPSRLSLPLTSREGQNQATTSSVSPPASETSPVEFDSAISYVNKIKNRFLDHPEIYRAFLEILHTYQVQHW